VTTSANELDERAHREFARYGRTRVYRGELLRHPVYTRFLHWSVAIFFVLSLLTGFAIYSPWLFHWIAPLFGGGPRTRALHPWFGLVFEVAFFFQFLNWMAPMAWKEADRRWMRRVRQYATNDPPGALVEAALEEVRLLEKLDYRDFKISVKSSSVPVMIQAYRRLSEVVPYPLHLGVTEAGPAFTGTVKSAIGMGSLLVDGIGDTMRVSLTADPVEEVKVAWEILRVLGLRHKGPVMIACPSCGRTNVDVLDLAERVEERLSGYDEVFEVAVMGCAVNGPGEAGDADFGIAGGRDAGFIYAHGEVLRKVTQTALVDELFGEIDAWIAGGMVRPQRKTRKLSLPVVQAAG